MQEEEFLEELSIIQNGDAQIVNETEKFLAKIEKTSPELLPFVKARLKQKELAKVNNKEKAKSLSEVTKELLEGEYVKLDEDLDFTISDLLVSRATANLVQNEKLTFKELNDAQKVISNDVAKDSGGFHLTIVTNGQDLGA